MTAAHYRAWSPVSTNRLKDLWWDGKSLAECCAILGATSVRAVKEKIDRENFGRNPAIKRIASGEVLTPLQQRDGSFITAASAKDHQCRWIDAVVPHSDSPMCGRPAVRGSWCAGHALRAYSRGSQ